MHMPMLHSSQSATRASAQRRAPLVSSSPRTGDQSPESKAADVISRVGLVPAETGVKTFRTLKCKSQEKGCITHHRVLLEIKNLQEVAKANPAIRRALTGLTPASQASSQLRQPILQLLSDLSFGKHNKTSIMTRMYSLGMAYVPGGVVVDMRELDTDAHKWSVSANRRIRTRAAFRARRINRALAQRGPVQCHDEMRAAYACAKKRTTCPFEKKNIHPLRARKVKRGRSPRKYQSARQRSARSRTPPHFDRVRDVNEFINRLDAMKTLSSQRYTEMLLHACGPEPVCSVPVAPAFECVPLYSCGPKPVNVLSESAMIRADANIEYRPHQRTWDQIMVRPDPDGVGDCGDWTWDDHAGLIDQYVQATQESSTYCPQPIDVEIEQMIAGAELRSSALQPPLIPVALTAQILHAHELQLLVIGGVESNPGMMVSDDDPSAPAVRRAPHRTHSTVHEAGASRSSVGAERRIAAAAAGTSASLHVVHSHGQDRPPAVSVAPSAQATPFGLPQVAPTISSVASPIADASPPAPSPGAPTGTAHDKLKPISAGPWKTARTIYYWATKTTSDTKVLPTDVLPAQILRWAKGEIPNSDVERMFVPDNKKLQRSLAKLGRAIAPLLVGIAVASPSSFLRKAAPVVGIIATAHNLFQAESRGGQRLSAFWDVWANLPNFGHDFTEAPIGAHKARLLQTYAEGVGVWRMVVDTLEPDQGEDTEDVRIASSHQVDLTSMTAPATWTIERVIIDPPSTPFYQKPQHLEVVNIAHGYVDLRKAASNEIPCCSDALMYVNANMVSYGKDRSSNTHEANPSNPGLLMPFLMAKALSTLSASYYANFARDQHRGPQVAPLSDVPIETRDKWMRMAYFVLAAAAVAWLFSSKSENQVLPRPIADRALRNDRPSRFSVDRVVSGAHTAIQLISNVAESATRRERQDNQTIIRREPTTLSAVLRKLLLLGNGFLSHIAKISRQYRDHLLGDFDVWDWLSPSHFNLALPDYLQRVRDYIHVWFMDRAVWPITEDNWDRLQAFTSDVVDIATSWRSFLCHIRAFFGRVLSYDLSAFFDRCRDVFPRNGMTVAAAFTSLTCWASSFFSQFWDVVKSYCSSFTSRPSQSSGGFDEASFLEKLYASFVPIPRPHREISNEWLLRHLNRLDPTNARQV